jgi:hypothetical protein
MREDVRQIRRISETADLAHRRFHDEGPDAVVRPFRNRALEWATNPTTRSAVRGFLGQGNMMRRA